ncbi:MAG: glycoside hydrolase, partial [Verrucomicrobia bacterium]|nr:glycoside hydrolase [Verrucomicrobiota bacterium]
CASAGGGTVRLAGGRFLSGTIRLRSHVTLHIEGGATLLGSTNILHYPHHIPAIRSYTDTYVKQSLIVGEDLEDIGLVGRGTIDGQGPAFRMADRNRPYENRPYLIRLIHCRDILVEDLRLRRSPMWMQHYLGCERLVMRGVHVWNFGNANNDALDIDGCKDVAVSGCVFESDDDAITLKSTFERPCEGVTIGGCVARSHCNAIKMGTESSGGFRDISIANCVVTSPLETNTTYGCPRGMGGIALELVDGGRLERVAIANVTIRGVMVPLFLRLGDRARPYREGMAPPPPGSFRDVTLQNIVATDVGRVGCSITGLTNAILENVSLANIQFRFEGGGARALTEKSVAELPRNYPEGRMFGELPAYGFYCRHVKGLRFSGIRLQTDAPDLRHAMVFDDAEGVVVDGLDADFATGAAALLRFVQTRGAVVRGCQPRAPGGTFVSLAGDATRDIALLGNDLSGAASVADIPPGVPKAALTVR